MYKPEPGYRLIKGPQSRARVAGNREDERTRNEGSLKGYLVAVTNALISSVKAGDGGKCVLHWQGGGLMADGH